MARKPSIGLSGLVAAILLIAIVVAAAVVVSGVFFNLANIGGRRPTVYVDQIKLVATPAGAATFGIVLKNSGDVPIHGTNNPIVSFSGLPGGCTLPAPTNWSGSRNPGGTLSATSTAASGCAGLIGTTVTVTITVTFADNSAQVLTVGITGTVA
ncbi:MAG: archaellin/type IV pilin N-terminal domain-containing protein [Candidatus Caldarchaeum sp.]|nr:archaellin/type IV pilin N-terminal domain-containing protein [Candidatus Caldarchaeum sp.]